MNHKRALNRLGYLIIGLSLWGGCAGLLYNYAPNSLFISLDAYTTGVKVLFSILLSFGAGMLMMFFSILLYSILYDDHNGSHYMRMPPVPSGDFSKKQPT